MPRSILRRWPTAAAILLLIPSFADGFLLPPWFLPSMAVIYLIFGVVRRQLRPAGEVVLQLSALIALAGAAVSCAILDPVASAYVFAAALLGHGVWDVTHWRRDRVVPRAYAEFCGVFDLLCAVVLVAATALPG
jgi:uncharacterized membrane protein HdeD (DUF308 family)